MRKEVEEKLRRIRKFMEDEGYEGVLFTSNENFFWISGGRSAFVDKGTGLAASKILVTKDKQYVICNSSERCRVMEEELTEEEFELISYLWYENEKDVLDSLLQDGKCASDNGVWESDNRAADIQKQRYVLTEAEIARFREIGPESAEILEESCRRIHRGESELEIAARTVQMLMEKGYQVPVCLVAADERLIKYRHPIPTEKRVKKYAMTAICAQKYGLTVSVSRIISLGGIDAEKARRMEAVQRIDAAFILNTKAGVKAKDVLKKGFESYVQEGYREDFHLHHQGGALGYPTRDYCVNFEHEETVLDKQGFSWNPTIAGVKSEDTILVVGETQEVISYTGKWVYQKVTLDGRSILRPDILVIQED